MVKIGNIVTFGQTKLFLEQFNIVESYEDINASLPTLLVGYTETKAINNELNFIDRKINDKLFWTTTRLEDRYIFNKDLESFVDYCEKKLTDGFEYFFINPFEITISEVKNILKNINSFIGTYHCHKDMVYIYANGYTYGFHGEIGDVYGIKTKRVLDYITTHNYTQISESDIDYIESSLKDVDYDQSQLIFLKQKFL